MKLWIKGGLIGLLIALVIVLLNLSFVCGGEKYSFNILPITLTKASVCNSISFVSYPLDFFYAISYRIYVPEQAAEGLSLSAHVRAWIPLLSVFFLAALFFVLGSLIGWIIRRLKK